MRRVEPCGSPDAKLCLVGEAPGSDEIDKGEPFVGRSGQLLMDALARIGLTRDSVYITNVVKEQPPRNDIASFLPTVKGSPAPTPEYLAYEEELHAELASCGANCFVALGNTALWALTRQNGILKRRGSLYPAVGEGITGRKVLASLHPSGILRGGPTTWHQRLLLQHDLKRAMEESASPELHLPERELIIHPNKPSILRYIRDCLGKDCMGFDIETTVKTIGGSKYAKDMFCFSLSKSPGSSMTVPLLDSNGQNCWGEADERQILEATADLLQFEPVLKVGQNLTFDSTWLYERLGIVINPIADTMIAHRILYPDLPADLGFLCSMFTHEPYYKDTGQKFFAGKGNWDQFLEYSAKDSAVCLDIWPQLEKLLHQQGNWEVYERHVRSIHPILYIQRHGIRADEPALKAASKNADEAIAMTQAKLDAMAGRPLNVKSPKQIKDYFTEKKVKLPMVGGKTSTDAKSMKKLVARGVEEAKLISAIRRLRDDQSKYWKAKLKDGKLHCSVKPVGTKQGRFSSTIHMLGYGVNFQNQPPRMKDFMLADPDSFFIEIDLSQAENRIVAWLAEDFNMMQAFEQGLDVHCMTAGFIFGKSPAEVSSKKGSCSIGGGIESERYWGKRVNHASNYDIGPNELSENLECTIADAKFLLAKYHKAYPNVRGVFQRDVQEELRRGMTLVNLMGRKRRYLQQWTSELLKEGYSFKPQSTVADIINERGITPLFYDTDTYDCIELVNQVHDSIVMQAPFTRIPDVAHAMRALTRSLEQPLTAKGRTFVIPADAMVGTCLAKLEKNEDPCTGKMRTVDFHGADAEQQLEAALKGLQHVNL